MNIKEFLKMVGEINKNLKAKIIQGYGDQKSFAEQNNISEGTVSRVVRGRFNLTPAEQKQWADALGADPDQLFQ
jgi:transcriptional regulator with XRE-family HTH domain